MGSYFGLVAMVIGRITCMFSSLLQTLRADVLIKPGPVAAAIGRFTVRPQDRAAQREDHGVSGLCITVDLVVAVLCMPCRIVHALLLCRLAKPNFTYNTSTFMGDCG